MLLSVVNALAQVAQIGSTEYATLDDALRNAKAGETVKITQAGTYTLPGHPNSIELKNITVQGEVAGVVIAHSDISGGSGNDYGVIARAYDGATFKNVKFSLGSTNYHAFREAGTINMENCTIDGLLYSSGDMNFTNCQFTQPDGDYNMCTYSGNVTYNNCTFTNSVKSKFVNVYNDDGLDPVTITFNECAFVNDGSASKAAINVKATSPKAMLKYSVIVNNCTTQGNFPAPSKDDVLQVISNLVQVDDRVAGEDNIEVTVDGAYVYYHNGDLPAAQASVAQIGNVKYATLQEAFNAAQDGDEVTLLADYDATGEYPFTAPNNNKARNLGILKGITFDGANHTLTVKGSGIWVGGGSSNVDVTFKDIIIVNTASGARCIDTRGKIGTLTLDNVTLNTQGAPSGYTQPLTIGGNQSEIANVIVTNGSVIQTNENGTAYYAIITFNPVNMTIEDSTIKGWACIYAKGQDGSAGSAGSTFTINNSTLVSSNAYSGVTNSFAAFVMEDNNVTVNVTNSEITLNNTGDQVQAIANAKGKTGAVVNLGEGNEVTFVEPGNFAFALNDAEVKVSGGEFNVEVPENCCAEGYVPTTLENGKYGVKKVVAQIDDAKYETLAEAIAAATSGQTIELLADVDLSSHARSAADDIILTNITLDLNGKTIRGFNNGVRYSGTNAVIKNGTFDFVAAEPRPNYGLSIGSYTEGAAVSENMILQDLNVIGGINIDLADVTLNNVNIDMNQSTFYAIWVDEDNTTAIYNSGTINAGSTATAVFGVAQTNASLKIAGGNINTNGETFRLGGKYKPVEVSGGLFDVQVPNDCCAAGYETVAKDDKWTVGKVVTGTLTAEEGSTDAQATYSVQATVQDAEGETLATKTEQTVTVSIVTEADDDKKVASDATISKLNMETVVAKAITTEAAADADNINVSIAVVSEEPAQAEQTYTYEVYPEATITVNEASSTVKLANSDLAENAEFTFTLDVSGKFDDGASIQVVHKSADFDAETFTTSVVDGKVSITVSHFSSFELSEVVTANISDVGFATFSSTKAVDFTGIDAIHAYTAAMNGKIIEFTRIYQVPANTGLLIRNPNGASAVSVDVPVIELNTTVSDNALVPVSADIADGNLPDEDGDYSNYILNKVDGVVGFYRPNGWGVAKGRAYLRVLTSSVSGVQSFTNLFDGETTAIDSITTADEQTQDNVFYDLSGRRVNNPQRGLYIVNGKKVLVK